MTEDNVRFVEKFLSPTFAACRTVLHTTEDVGVDDDAPTRSRPQWRAGIAGVKYVLENAKKL